MESSGCINEQLAKIDKWREDMAYEHKKREDQIY
jgi:hypothetical protein